MPLQFTSRRERRLWLLAAGWILVIYSTLGVARPASEWLRDREALGPVVFALFALALAGVAAWAVRERLSAKAIAVLVCFAAAYPLAARQLPRAEERVHFVEYGLVGGLVYSALLARRAPAERGLDAVRPAGLGAAVAAASITALAGWGDELIQALLPSRFYDLRDVAFNAGGGALAVAAVATLGRIRERRRRGG